MKITVSQRRGQAKVTGFDGVREINTLDELKEVARFDHVSAVLGEHTDERTGKFEKYHRSEDCFISADTLFMDCDNDSENPEEWIKPEEIAKRYPELKYYWIASRNNMKEKDGKSPRPRWHIYFPLSREHTDKNEYRALKRKVLSYIPEFDKACKEASRLHFGVENPTGGEHDGAKFLDEIMAELPDKVKKSERGKKGREPIKDGDRNTTLYNFAIASLMNYPHEKARVKFDERSLDCENRLEDSELEAIWQSAMKSNLVQLLDVAMTVIENYADDDDDGFDVETIKKFYLDEAKQISDDNKEIDSAWRTAKKRLKKSSRGTRTGGRVRAADTPLTFKDVQEALKEDGITIKTNVITKETEVKGIPDDSPFAPDGYAELSEGKKALISADVIGSYLTPKLKEGNFNFSESYLTSVLSTLAKMNETNPVADFIKKTEWDGVDRVAELNKILGIDGNPLYCTYMRKFFIQAVAMAMNDEDAPRGNEFVPVFQGGQGIGKTELIRRMALRPEWFAEGWSYDANNKDTAITASKVWICELGELDNTLKKNQAALKSFLTSVYDRYRAPYARNEQKTLRHTTFCATVNDEKFLIDTEGGTRRWAVIRLKKDFHRELFNLRDDFFTQVYAQAYQAYMQGETFRLTHEERIALEAENENVAVPKKGEQELTECLNWEADAGKWSEKTALDIINGAELHGISLKDMSKALRKVEKQDSRVKSRRLGRGWVFILPPFRGKKGENFYAPTLTGRDDAGGAMTGTRELNERETTVRSPETIELYKNLLESYRRNKCKISFDDFVRNFGASTLAKFLKRPLSYDAAEQIKTDIISYHHIYAA